MIQWFLRRQKYLYGVGDPKDMLSFMGIGSEYSKWEFKANNVGQM